MSKGRRLQNKGRYMGERLARILDGAGRTMERQD